MTLQALLSTKINLGGGRGEGVMVDKTRDKILIDR
jgi:hypothetical protein